MNEIGKQKLTFNSAINAQTLWQIQPLYGLLLHFMIWGVCLIMLDFSLKFSDWKSMSCLKICLFNLSLFHLLKETKCKMNIVLLAFNFMKICSMLQSRCIRKAGRIKITAKFELKPPPYPLVRSKVCPLLHLLLIRINRVGPNCKRT